MTLIYGNFREDLSSSNQFLLISFAPSSIPLQQRWRNNGLSADFVADYMATFFPDDENNPDTLNRQSDLKGAVSYIANELLENAMKYHPPKALYPITFGIHLLGETVILFSTNCITEKNLKSLQVTIKELLRSDLETLYIEKLETLAETNNITDSGLGLITVMNDYAAQIGWKIDPIVNNAQLMMLTTMVQVQF